MDHIVKATASKTMDMSAKPQKITWNPWLAVGFVVLVYYLSQIIGGLVISIYPALHHWTQSQANHWVQNSVGAQFIYIVIAEALTIGATYGFIRLCRGNWSTIGLRRPSWSDPLWGWAALPVYFIAYFAVVGVLKQLIPALNVDQQQQVGFSGASGLGLLMTFISLVVLPPLVEEIVVRGFLYGSLKKALPIIPAALVTSAIFGSAHLQAGSGAPLLWIAFIDTFVLSLILIYLREKTGNLWAGITLHATKNLFAFASLFLFHLH